MRKRDRVRFYQVLHADAHVAWRRLFRAISDYLDGRITEQELRDILHTPHRTEPLDL